jgi:hypothetical protein
VEEIVRVGNIREQILSRRTLTEAQLLVLKARHKNPVRMGEATPDMRDLSVPLPVKNYRQVMPDTPMLIPRGCI